MMMFHSFVVFFPVCYGLLHECLHDTLWLNGTQVCKISDHFQNYSSIPTYQRGLRITMETNTIKGCMHTDAMMKTFSSKGCFIHICEKVDLISQKALDKMVRIVKKATVRLESLIQVKSIMGSLLITNLQTSDECTHECLGVKSTVNGFSGNFEETDFLLFMSLQPVGLTAVAWSVPLAVDQYQRPIAGLLNIGARFLVDDTIEDIELETVVLHELFHLLGFSFRTTQQDPPVVSTPAVVTAMQQHVGCSSLTDVPLDTNSSSHWNARFFMNELMTSRLTGSTATLSSMTLALLNDMPWYSTSLFENTMSSYEWGENAGCSFFNAQNCSVWESDYFCQAKERGCSANKQWTTSCGATTYSNPIAATDQGDKVYDYCTLMIPTVSCLASTNSLDTSRYGEEFTSTSRCFNSSIYHGMGDPHFAGRCYEHRCYNASVLAVKLADVWYNCTQRGDTMSISGYEGTFTCPSVEEYCAPSGPTCSPSCSEHGVCINGHCHCAFQWTGSTCNEQQCVQFNGVECGTGECDRSTGTCICNDLDEGCKGDDDEITKLDKNSDGVWNSNVTWTYFSVAVQAEEHLQVTLKNNASGENQLMFFASFYEKPTLTVYDYFDELAWMNNADTHTLNIMTMDDAKIVFIGVWMKKLESIEMLLRVMTLPVNVPMEEACAVLYPLCQGTCTRPTFTFFACKDCDEGKGGKDCSLPFTKWEHTTSTTCSLIEMENNEWKYLALDVPEGSTLHVSLNTKVSSFQLFARPGHQYVPALGDSSTRTSYDAMVPSSDATQSLILDTFGSWVIGIYTRNDIVQGPVRVCTKSVTSVACTGSCSGGGTVAGKECICQLPWVGACCDAVQGTSWYSLTVSEETTLVSGLAATTSPAKDLLGGQMQLYRVTAAGESAFRVSGGSTCVVWVTTTFPRSIHDAIMVLESSQEWMTMQMDTYFIVVQAMSDTSVSIVVRPFKDVKNPNLVDNEGDTLPSSPPTLLYAAAGGTVLIVIVVIILFALKYNKIYKTKDECTGFEDDMGFEDTERFSSVSDIKTQETASADTRAGNSNIA